LMKLIFNIKDRIDAENILSIIKEEGDRLQSKWVESLKTDFIEGNKDEERTSTLKKRMDYIISLYENVEIKDVD